MPDSSPVPARVRVDGKFFKAGNERFLVRGVTYGTFAPNQAREPFPEPAEVQRDFGLIRDLGANTVRVYDVPPRWLLEAGAAQGLRFLVTVPWSVQSCFLDTRTRRREVRTGVMAAVQAIGAHPAVFAIALANEIPPDIVRWSGTRRVAAFLDDLAEAAREAAPDCLLTFANYPPSEFLQPRGLDFITFNLFLHHPQALADYLAHLHMVAGDLPLLLGECGVDTRGEGLDAQSRILEATLATAEAAGLAGAVIFSFTDDWHRNGRPVTEWTMGLTTADRRPKPAFEAVRARFTRPSPVPPLSPKVSVVVATYNSAPTLRACLESLRRLNHPHYEVIVVDDGSIDETPEITAEFPDVRTLRLRANLGLSHARNLGIRTATGEIIAFTDADCEADPDWLRFLVPGLLDGQVVGIGGPNLLPSDDSTVAATVMAAPGGPTHVMLSEREAEHLPGCNMAFWKWALDALGGFDPVFHTAGDDVDLCWRLHRRGWRLGFSPAAFVWHHRRTSIRAYLQQQAGYGQAEALLRLKHPAQFNALGSARWQGRLGTSIDLPFPWRRPVIYHGHFATGLFQSLYAPAADGWLPLLTSLEYHLFLALPLGILAVLMPGLWPLAAGAVAVPMAVSVAAARRAVLPLRRSRPASRLLLALLCYLQPLVRGAARWISLLGHAAPEAREDENLEAQSRLYAGRPAAEFAFWTPAWRDRREWIQRILDALEKRHWPCRADAGWSDYDLEIFGGRWTRIELATVSEATRDGGQTLRCRLRSRWATGAHVLFWGVVVALLVTIGVFDVDWRGWWVPLASLGTVLAFFRHQGRRLRCRLAVVLEAVARDWGLSSIDGGEFQIDTPSSRTV